MTVIYDIQSEKVLSWHDNGYLVNGKPGLLHEGIIELEVVYSTRPEDDPLKRIEESWIVEGNQYKQVWTVVDKTEIELQRETWKYEYPLRLIAPKALLEIYPTIALKLMIRGLPIVEEGDFLHVYMNVVSAEDQALVDANQGVITIETYP